MSACMYCERPAGFWNCVCENCLAAGRGAPEVRGQSIGRNAGFEAGSDENIEGLGGWLILVGIGVVLSPIIVIATALPPILAIFSNGVWLAIITPASNAYNPALAALLMGELLINCLLVLVEIYAAYLFFSKGKLFSKLFIGILSFNVVFIIFDVLAVKGLFPQIPMFDSETIKSLARASIAAAIWIPYMLISKRVNATFVK